MWVYVVRQDAVKTLHVHTTFSFADGDITNERTRNREKEKIWRKRKVTPAWHGFARISRQYEFESRLFRRTSRRGQVSNRVESTAKKVIRKGETR